MLLLISGTIFILSGGLLKFPPKDINGLIGYRTSMSMKNNDTWNESQKYDELSIIILVIVNLILELILYILKRQINTENLQLIFIILSSIIMIIACDLHLKKYLTKMVVENFKFIYIKINREC